MHADQHGPFAAEAFLEGLDTSVKIQMISIEFPVLTPGRYIEHQIHILRKMVVITDHAAKRGLILEIQIIFGKSLFHNRTIVPEAALKTLGPESAVGQKQVDSLGVFFGIGNVFFGKSAACITFDSLQTGTCMPGVDVSLTFFLFEIIKLSRIVHPDTGGCHVIDKSCCVGSDDG